MKRPMDRQPPRRTIDAHGRVEEHSSEYFDFAGDPEKAGRKVTRLELYFWLDRTVRVQRDSQWHRRFWRWLMTPWNGRTPKVGELKRETERAEAGVQP